METRFPALSTTFKESVRGGVPKLHIRTHKELCQLSYSFTYTKYSGMTCGEGIESAWAEQNHAAGSTKEQSTGHRQDTLDDYNAYWNQTKLHRLRVSIIFIVFSFISLLILFFQQTTYCLNMRSTHSATTKLTVTLKCSHAGSLMMSSKNGKTWRTSPSLGGMGNASVYFRLIQLKVCAIDMCLSLSDLT